MWSTISLILNYASSLSVITPNKITTVNQNQKIFLMEFKIAQT